MEGLRTLVITHKMISEAQYSQFEKNLKQAKASLGNREENILKVICSLEDEMDFLAVTGVEDKLQENVLVTIETLRQAGINVWMLTGDKIETAKCIAIATGLKSKKETIFEMIDLETRKDLTDEKGILEAIDRFVRNIDSSMLMITGTTLDIVLSNEFLMHQFFSRAIKAKSVCVCRCSPLQKAAVAKQIIKETGKRIACVGDGGNDVPMIMEADVGLGIVGKEGKQASLAADFSIMKFKDIAHLLLWHGRLSYKRSASLSQFVVHRGMIISFIQAIFTCVFFFVDIPIYNGYLILGYSTAYTMLPVFTLVLDEDVTLDKVQKYPALYRTLQKGRSMNLKTFMIWTWVSIYQVSAHFIYVCRRRPLCSRRFLLSTTRLQTS